MGDSYCDVCDKEVNQENCVERNGKLFCCEQCEGHHNDPDTEDTKDAVCEFC